MRTSFLLLPVLAASACGVDTAPDAPITCGEPRVYRIDRVHFATTGAELRETSLDLDRDGVPDNGLGALISAVRTANPDIGDLDAKAAARLGGDTTWRLSVSDCDDGQHVAIGDSGGGDAAPLSVLVDPVGGFAPVAWVRAERVASRLTITDGDADGQLAFAIRMPDAADALLAPTAAYLSGELASGISPLAATLDLDKDGAITVAELRASSWIQTLTRPDLSLDASGVPAAMSAGVSIHATRVRAAI